MRQPDVCEITDKMIDMAIKHRSALKQAHDEVIYAEVTRKLYENMQAWGATDYLDIAWNIRVKPKGQ